MKMKKFTSELLWDKLTVKLGRGKKNDVNLPNSVVKKQFFVF
jgi:hypothetical protein